MPRFFTYFHAPVLWGLCLLGLWIGAWLLAFPGWGILGVPVLSLLTLGWATLSWRHYSPRRIHSSRAPSRDRGPGLAELATRQNFFLGTIGTSHDLASLPTVLGSEFNSLTPAYETKWDTTLRFGRIRQYDFSAADRLVDAALRRGVRVRGHVLLWGKFNLPRDLEPMLAAAHDPVATLQELIAEHIDTVVGHFRGRIGEWDVVNEPLDHRSGQLDFSVFLRYLGEPYLDFAFARARAVAPECRLYLNEQLWSYRGVAARRFLELAKRLRTRGVPIDGIGLQSHVNTPPIPSPADLQAYLRQLADLGFDLEITEFDAVLRYFRTAHDPHRAQGEYFRAMLAACLSVPRCRGLTVWGHSDADSWYTTARHYRRFGPHSAHLFDETMHPKWTYWGFHRALSECTGRSV